MKINRRTMFATTALAVVAPTSLLSNELPKLPKGIKKIEWVSDPRSFVGITGTEDPLLVITVDTPYEWMKSQWYREPEPEEGILCSARYLPPGEKYISCSTKTEMNWVNYQWDLTDVVAFDIFKKRGRKPKSYYEHEDRVDFYNCMIEEVEKHEKVLGI